MIVLDANILVRAVLGRRVREILEAYQPLGVSFVAPDMAFDDAEKYAIAETRRRGKSLAVADETLAYLREIVLPAASDLYEPFEQEARRRLRGRDEDDWPILASALALKCDIWTEDTDFFGTGVATWTTSRVEILIKQQLQSLKPNED